MEQSNLSIFASELKTKTNMKKILFLLIGLFSLMNANRAVADTFFSNPTPRESASSLISCAFPYGHEGDERNTDTDDTAIF